MSDFFHGVRALKGQAPTAGQFNKMASNLEWVKARVSPRYFLANKSGDQTATTASTGAAVTITFPQEVADSEAMFNAGTITLPSDAKFIRAICNLYFSAEVNQNTSVTLFYPGGSTIQQFAWVAAQNNSIADGVQAMHLDTGWQPISGTGSDILVKINGPFLTSWTIKANNKTWLSVEVL